MNERVLVADDDVELLDAIADVVEQSGRIAVKAHNGAELIDVMAGMPFDLVITDISMPWMSGLQVSHSARYAGLETPILVITALEDPAIADQVAALGEHARLLRKPFDIATLEEAIEELLGASAQHAQAPQS